MIRHIILFKARTGISQEEADSVFEALGGLEDKIPGILAYVPGVHQGSPRNQGFTHGFTMDFDSWESLKAYGPHPAHQEVKERLLSLTSGDPGDLLAFDYEIPG